VRQVVGSVAGAAVLIYIAGGAILSLRLTAAHLPSGAVLGQLPRDFLFSLGMSNAVLPALGLGAVYAAFRGTDLKKDGWQKRNRYHRRSFTEKRNEREKRRGWRDTAPWHITSCLLGAGLLVSPGAVVAATGTRHGEHNRDFVVVSLVCAWFLSALAIFLYLHVRTRLAERHQDNYRSAAAVAHHSLLVAGLMVPAAIVFWGSLPLSSASVCGKPGGGLRRTTPGVLVGETKERVYIGVGREIRSLPLSEVAGLRIGAPRDEVCDG
jgi:hypothetical protein